MTAFAGENGHVQQKLETAEAVRHADDSDVFEMQEVAVKRKWQGTEIDRKEMSQLGRVQELRVSLYRILSYGLATRHGAYF
jgi:predicted secreted Zn-dependent protease